MAARLIPLFDAEIVDLDAPWRTQASCHQRAKNDPLAARLWDSKEKTSDAFKAASAICEECPVREMCIPDAVADMTSTGNRGGIGFDKGTVLTSDAVKINREFGLNPALRKGGFLLAEAG